MLCYNFAIMQTLWRRLTMRTAAIIGLGLIALLALGSMGGYWSGIGVRQSTEKSIRTTQLTEQFQYALVDEQFGRYDSARQRLEFIIGKDPNFPGAQNELANVLVKSTIPTATLTPTITPTPDLRGNEAMLASAKQLVAAGDLLGDLRTDQPGQDHGDA